MKRTIPISLWIICLALPGFPLRAETRLSVRHDHGLRSCRGELVFSEQQVEYITTNKKDARVWKYADIQQVGLLSEKKISVVSYEDQKLAFGKDKRFRFGLLEGAIPESLWSFLQTRLSRPLVSERIPTGIVSKAEIPVKHQHALGGCQGVLKIGELFVIYETPDKQDSRIWRFEDISSMGSTGPFQLRLTSMERTGWEIGGEKNFIFDLKRRLESDVYDFIWWKINGPKISLK